MTPNVAPPVTPTAQQSLGALFSAFPAPDSANPEHTALAYLMAVEGEPDAAIAEAVRRFIRGEVRRERHTFMPSTAELAIEVRVRTEHTRLRAAAEARAALPSSRSRQQIEAPISPEERNKVAKLMAGLAGQLRTHEKPKPASGEELAETAFDLAGVQASPALINALRLGKDAGKK